jgi:hypothetical protein
MWFLVCVASVTALSTVTPRPRPDAGVALNGNDVVAYHALLSAQDAPAHIVHNAHDVLGMPQFKRFVNASTRLRYRPDLLNITDGSYEFWFTSAANAEAFEKEPGRYIPAFGGHCTHGLASRNDLNASLVVDGRVAFTCVNTTQWSLINGTVYMNSCGMYAVGRISFATPFIVF